MGKTSFTINAHGLLKGLDTADKSVKEKLEQGMGRAMLLLRTLVISRPPTAPIKEGFLRGSISIFVQNKKIEAPTTPGEDRKYEVKAFTIPMKPGEMVGIIGVNVPYAARTHEVPMHFSDPDAGNKYVESKMANYKSDLLNEVGASILEVTKGD